MHIVEPDVKAPPTEPTVLDHVPGDNTEPNISDQVDPVDGADPAGGDQPGDGADPNAGGDQPDPIEELRSQNAQLQARLEELSEKLESKAGDQPDEGEGDKPPAPRAEPTPEEWSKIEKDWGFVRAKDENNLDVVQVDPQKIIKSFVSRMDYLFAEAKKYADSVVHGNTSDIRFDAVLTDMAAKPGFQDIRSYSDAIRKTMNTRYMPKDRSNPKFIEAAYFEAKGRNQKNVLKQVKDGKEIKRTIVRPGQPSGGAPSRGGRLTPETMTAEQKKIAEATFRGVPPQKAYEEYARLY